MELSVTNVYELVFVQHREMDILRT